MVGMRSTCRFVRGPPTSTRLRSADAHKCQSQRCGWRWPVVGILWLVIGILGGTFDPPHIAHLAMAQAAYDQLGLDEIVFMPAGDPWQKSGDVITPAIHRLAMTRLAASAAPYFAADDREVRRSGPTYTIDTVEEVGEDCVLLVGADALRGVRSWNRADELIDLVSFAVVDRPGVARDEVDEGVLRKCTWIEMPRIDISSTEIRSHVATGHTARFLVPEAVSAYIETNGLYMRGSS
jgi:nicotinate-nucleotide adenylyltransferase